MYRCIFFGFDDKDFRTRFGKKMPEKYRLPIFPAVIFQGKTGSFVLQRIGDFIGNINIRFHGNEPFFFSGI